MTKETRRTSQRHSANLDRMRGMISYISYFAGFANFSLDFFEVLFQQGSENRSVAAKK
jgi:hypothetical protein